MVGTEAKTLMRSQSRGKERLPRPAAATTRCRSVFGFYASIIKDMANDVAKVIQQLAGENAAVLGHARERGSSPPGRRTDKLSRRHLAAASGSGVKKEVDATVDCRESSVPEQDR